MEVDVKMREEQLSEVDAFINESYDKIDDILKTFGWSREHTEKESEEMVCCPLNREHRMPKKTVEKHIETCTWRMQGYHSYDVPFSVNSVADGAVPTSVRIDETLQASIIAEAKEKNPSMVTGDLSLGARLIPRSSDRFMADFTTDERRALYDYAVSMTSSLANVKVQELQMIEGLKKEDKPQPKSKLELLIEQRDAKRRRMSYRKKVHTNRKTHTEILREVIQNQMEVLEQLIKGEHPERENTTDDNDAEDDDDISDTLINKERHEKECDSFNTKDRKLPSDKSDFKCKVLPSHQRQVEIAGYSNTYINTEEQFPVYTRLPYERSRSKSRERERWHRRKEEKSYKSDNTYSRGREKYFSKYERGKSNLDEYSSHVRHQDEISKHRSYPYKRHPSKTMDDYSDTDSDSFKRDHKNYKRKKTNYSERPYNKCSDSGSSIADINSTRHKYSERLHCETSHIKEKNNKYEQNYRSDNSGDYNISTGTSEPSSKHSKHAKKRKKKKHKSKSKHCKYDSSDASSGSSLEELA